MVSDPHFLWWALLFDGWLTTDALNGYGYGGYGGGYGNGKGRRTYGQ